MAIEKPANISKIWAATGAKVDPGDAKYDLGWVAEIPGHENFNFMQNVLSASIAYINERGIGEWDAVTSYALYAQALGSDGIIYSSLQPDNKGNDPIQPGTASWKAGVPGVIQAVIPLVLDNSVTGAISSNMPLRIRAHANQSVNLITIEDSSGASLMRVHPLGTLTLDSPADAIKLTVVSGSNQTADLIHVETKEGTALNVDRLGSLILTVRNSAAGFGAVIQNTATGIGSGKALLYINNASGNPAAYGLEIRAAVNQTGRLFNITDSAGNFLASFHNGGALQLGADVTLPSGGVTITPEGLIVAVHNARVNPPISSSYTAKFNSAAQNGGLMLGGDVGQQAHHLITTSGLGDTTAYINNLGNIGGTGPYTDISLLGDFTEVEIINLAATGFTSLRPRHMFRQATGKWEYGFEPDNVASSIPEVMAATGTLDLNGDPLAPTEIEYGVQSAQIVAILVAEVQAMKTKLLQLTGD